MSSLLTRAGNIPGRDPRGLEWNFQKLTERVRRWNRSYFYRWSSKLVSRETSCSAVVDGRRDKTPGINEGGEFIRRTQVTLLPSLWISWHFSPPLDLLNERGELTFECCISSTLLLCGNDYAEFQISFYRRGCYLFASMYSSERWVGSYIRSLESIGD